MAIAKKAVRATVLAFGWPIVVVGVVVGIIAEALEAGRSYAHDILDWSISPDELTPEQMSDEEYAAYLDAIESKSISGLSQTVSGITVIRAKR